MQNSVNHRDFERIWHFQVPPGSMFLRVEFPTHLGASLPSQGARVRTGVGLWRGVLSHERAAALAEVGECGARSGCLRAVGGLPPETDDRGSRRRASGLCAATVAGGLGAPYLAHMCTAMPARRTSTGGLSDRRRSTRVLALNSLHRMEQDYPLNLSISLSGGKETNRDAPSNGE